MEILSIGWRHIDCREYMARTRPHLTSDERGEGSPEVVTNSTNESDVRVAYLLDGLTLGGAQTNAISFAIELKKFGVQSIFISSGGALEDLVERNGFENHHVDFSRTRRPLRILHELTRVIRKSDVDVIHSQTPLAGVYGCLVARFGLLPCIMTLHGRLDVTPSMLQPLGLRIEPFLLASGLFPMLADIFLPVSNEVREYAQTCLKLPIERMRVIPNAVHLPALEETGTTSIDSDYSLRTLKILFIGRVNTDKEIPIRTTVDAVTVLSHSGVECSLLIVGSGPLLDSIRNLCCERNRYLGKEIFGCMGGMQNLGSLLLGSDIIIAAGRSAIEALSHGKPTILFSNGGYCPDLSEFNIESVASSNFSGRGIRQPPTAREMAEDLARIAIDSNLRTDMSTIGFDFVTRFLNIEIAARTLYDTYRLLILPSERRMTPSRCISI